MPDGRKARCRPCTNDAKKQWRKDNEDKVRRQRLEEHARNRENYLAYTRSSERRAKWFKWKLQRQYGITVDDFERMMDASNGTCFICGESPSEKSGHRHKHRLHVDHDHTTKEVRGLLCNMCNAMIGYAKDDPEVLRAAIQYLETHQPNPVISYDSSKT
jgi:hypothetical protein